MELEAIIPDTYVNASKKNNAIGDGLKNLFGASHWWHGMFPGSESLAVSCTPLLSLDEIATKLWQSKVSPSHEQSLVDAQELVGMKIETTHWPDVTWEKFENYQDGETKYRLTPYILYGD